MVVNKKVLVVDDDYETASGLEKSFLKRGYRTKVIDNVEDAIADLPYFQPDYAVIDLRINGECGLECIKAFNEFDCKMKIVMITGYASITTIIEAIKSGACYYFAKPADADDIIAAFEGEFDGKMDFVPTQPQPQDINTSIKTIEWEHIHRVLVECDFNLSKAARILGMHRRTLARKLEKRRLS